MRDAPSGRTVVGIAAGAVAAALLASVAKRLVERLREPTAKQHAAELLNAEIDGVTVASEDVVETGGTLGLTEAAQRRAAMSRLDDHGGDGS